MPIEHEANDCWWYLPGYLGDELKILQGDTLCQNFLI